jgi:succinate dehydrogenase/fumarate reductase cytochrome b subunit
MLNQISWPDFLTILGLATALYYSAILLLCYRKHFFSWIRKRLGLTALLATSVALVRAQDGNAAISQADSMMRQYFTTGINLMYSVSAVIALIGAIRVYRVWNADEGHGQAYRAAAAWFGSCVFLVLVATVIRSFFGL